MNRWGVRIFGVVMLLIFAVLFLHLQRRLLELRQQRGANPPAATAR